MPDYTTAELSYIAEKAARERFGLRLEAGLVPRIERHIEEEHRSAIRTQNASLAIGLVDQAVEQMTRRVTSAGSKEGAEEGVLLAADFGIRELSPEEEERKMEHLQQELDKLVGMAGPKEHLQRQLALARFVRQGGSPKLLETCLNLVLVGNPGTGKSTFARLFCKLLRAHGVLKRDVFIERNALELKGEYCGQTAPKIRELFEMAVGGCLFLDEAYALASGDKFSNEAIRMLLTEVENHRKDVLVVLAGYEGKMAELLRADPGLSRRFPRVLRLHDYTAKEIAAIARQTAEGAGVPFEAGVEEALAAWLLEHMGRLEASLHNGGLAVNLTEAALARMADRMTASAPGLPRSLAQARLSLEDFGLPPRAG